jgi:sulfide:quinone oxidoreductase
LKIVIIGAGFAGHTAALYLGDTLGREHEITVVNRHEDFWYVPSWVWVGIGRMKVERTRFSLAPVYEKMHVGFEHGKAVSVHPDDHYVMVEPAVGGEARRLDYDYLLIATGPKLNYEATEGLGPKYGFTQSICTAPHAEAARDVYFEQVERMEHGETVRFVVGTGHATSTCQGAAFEYLTNIHKDLVRRKLRDKAELRWLSNEQAVGDFGVNGVLARYKGELVTSEQFISAVFREYDIQWDVQRAVHKVDEHAIYWEDGTGAHGETPYDFAMLIPQFKGVAMRYVGADGEDVSERLANASGFVKVDAIYGLPYERLRTNPTAWPEVYQNPYYEDIFAAGIAFAPPGPISAPLTTPNGTKISAAPPRTGMVSGITGRIVAKNLIDLVKHGRMTHGERMTEMAAACIASMGDSLWDGSAATIMIYPVVPDFRAYPNEGGRDSFVTHMEMGLGGAWMKRMIHSTFRHKLQARIGWKLIPE